MRRIAVAVGIIALAAAGCGGGEGGGGGAEGGAGDATSTGASGGGTETEVPGDRKAEEGSTRPTICETVNEPRPRRAQLRKPTLELDPAKEYLVTFETSCGRFQVALDARRSPVTGGSFFTLAREGFFDGLGFHRVVPGFVIQGGDPARDGSGGPGYKVRERPPRDVAYTRGVVAMAKAGNEPPGTSGSQFFVVTGSDAGLPPDYALVGEVTSGMDAVKRIEALGLGGQDGPPSRPVVIFKASASSR